MKPGDMVFLAQQQGKDESIADRGKRNNGQHDRLKASARTCLFGGRRGEMVPVIRAPRASTHTLGCGFGVKIWQKSLAAQEVWLIYL
ncbi:hypothetical protein [Noviherbaspirillum sp. ST9]|uniref:hypothetical protein n=1 Tax=Noviherbaspirillum sp. ST9 TaxID=3401606 RepID=UPI003B588E86